MKKLTAAVLFGAVCVGLAGANSPESPVPTRDPALIDSVKQVEQELGDAMVAVDVDRVSQVLADDWESVGMSGKTYRKEDFLRDLKSGKDKLEAFALGPMDVQVFGNVAAAHAGVTEKRLRDGKDTSGEFVWMDLLERRGGKWVIVRSAGARVK
jgi:hypothetical protein